MALPVALPVALRASDGPGKGQGRVQDLARSDLPVAAHLASWADQEDWTAVAEFTEELAQRRDELWDRGRDMATREQGLAQGSPGMVPDGAVPGAAVAARLRTLIVETGDDVATVATTLGVEPGWVRGVLTGEVSQAGALEVHRMCLALESTPHELFGATGPGSHLMPATLSWQISPARQQGEAAVFLPLRELRAYVASLDAPGRRGLVDALAHHHGVLVRWSQGLDAREERLARALAEPSPGPGPDDRGHGERGKWNDRRLDAPAGAAAALLSGHGVAAAEDRQSLGKSRGEVAFDPFIHDPLQPGVTLDLPDPPDLGLGP